MCCNQCEARGHIEYDDVELEVSYRVDEMSHVNKVIEVEQVFKLQDFEADLVNDFSFSFLSRNDCQ